MQSKLSAVKEMLAYLVNNNIIKEYEIKEHTIPEDEWRTSVRVNGLDLPLHSAYWYLQGIVDAQDLNTVN